LSHEHQVAVAKERRLAIPHDCVSTMDPSSSPAIPESSQPTAKASSPSAAEPRWSAVDLLKGAKEAIIVHGESVYRLRLTRSGKLILYK
jgi:hemin uptake protein HemP